MKLHPLMMLHTNRSSAMKSIPDALKRFRMTQLIKLAVLLLLLVSLIIQPFRQTVYAQTTGWQWYKVDTHVHSSVSADAFVDVGIHSQKAIANGYNAIFLTDHNGGSSFQINNLTANHMAFDDAYTRWDLGTFGSLTTTTNELVTTPVKTGTQSLHLRSTSNSLGETYVWTKRGPNLRSGHSILKVSIYPTRIDPGSGLYFSVSLGGDPTVDAATEGYTTTAGVVSPGKSTVLVWQLGSGRASSSDPNARVLTYPLNYTLNQWNNYSIDINNYLVDIPAADLPLDYNGLTYLKMTAASNGGTVEGYFDAYTIEATDPVPPADEYVYRTGIVDDFNTSTFKVFPSYEMGQQRHTNRFNFGITAPSQYLSYTYGSDGIIDTQQSGYPAQLNHPGTTITVQEAIDGKGLGADFMEVRDQAWIDAWDAILQQGVQILGNWSSDTHSGLSAGRTATYIYAPALDFDKLIQSLYEGRTYNALNNFTGQIILNLNSASQEPYPARYPVYVSDAQTNANVHMAVTNGLGSGFTMRWYRNGALLATDNRTGASYDATKSISLTGAFTYVRAEVRSSSASLRGMTQPIVFMDVTGLPTDKSFRIDKVTTADGKGYNKLLTKGITSASWNTSLLALSLTLEDPANSLVRLLMNTNNAPQRIVVGGATVPAAASLTDFDSATTSSWYYDSVAKLLYFKVLHATTIANVSVEFSSALPTSTPTPTSVVTNTPTSTSTPTGIILTPVADAYVDSSTPTTNYGFLTTLRADASPTIRSYLRFNVQGLTGPVTNATLRIFTNSNSNKGYDIYAVSNNSWTEGGINYSNAPVVGNKIGSVASFSPGTWTTVNVTTYITGDGTYSFALATTSNTSMNFASHEETTSSPQLIIQGPTGPTLTPTPTSAATSTATSTATFTATSTSTSLPTSTSTNTSTVTPTATNTGTPTQTSTITPTNTPANTPTDTAMPSETPTSTETGTPGPTDVPTDTPTITSTATNTPIPPPTNTPSATQTATATSVPPTNTPTLTPTNTPTNTATITPTATQTATATGGTSTFTFTATADSYVYESSPTTNYGAVTVLRTDGSPIMRSYLRFNVQGVSGTIKKVTLRVYANSASTTGYNIGNVADNTWTETGITYNNAPAIGTPVGSSGQFGTGVWTSVDVTSLVTGNGSVNLGLYTTNTTAISFNSRQATTNAPQLIVETTP